MHPMSKRESFFSKTMISFDVEWVDAMISDFALSMIIFDFSSFYDVNDMNINTRN